MTHRITRHPGAHGSTHYSARVGAHTIAIRSPLSWGDGGWRRWRAYVRLRGIDSTLEYDEYHAHGTTPRAAAEALLHDLPPHRRAEIAPALQAILDTPTLEPLP
jgi:hypothetical protein